MNQLAHAWRANGSFGQHRRRHDEPHPQAVRPAPPSAVRGGPHSSSAYNTLSGQRRQFGARGGAVMILVTGGTRSIGGELLRFCRSTRICRRPVQPETLPPLRRCPDALPAHQLLRRHGWVAAQRDCCSTRRGRDAMSSRYRHSPPRTTHELQSVDGTTRSRRNCEESGMGWTILRPHHFMQNLLARRGSSPTKVRSTRRRATARFRTSTSRHRHGRLRHATQPGHLGKKYVLTGSEAISYRRGCGDHRCGDRQAPALRRRVTEEARARRVREGLPPAVIESASRSPRVGAPAGRP